MHYDNEILSSCVEWDVTNWSKALEHWSHNLDLREKNYQCLELGARHGGLSLWLALNGNNVVCSDLQNPGETATKLHSKYGVRDRIKYQAIDATSIPYENYFDIVVFKSILGGIARNEKGYLMQKVVGEIYRSLKPGGKLLFAENLQASKFHQFLRKRLTGWGNYWNYLKLNQIDDLFREFESLHYNTAGFLGAFGRTEHQRNILGKLDSLIMERLVTNRMMYIVFGIATK
ncbi:MAG TPA: class I SAM-dependent methyltransferase [Cyclobacteriaceae bacterium]|nr:class I SAM-dependent methyltransferase [Cyclobacteriaceae bacterium]